MIAKILYLSYDSKKLYVPHSEFCMKENMPCMPRQMQTHHVQKMFLQRHNCQVHKNTVENAMHAEVFNFSRVY